MRGLDTLSLSVTSVAVWALPVCRYYLSHWPQLLSISSTVLHYNIVSINIPVALATVATNSGKTIGAFLIVGNVFPR